MKTPAVYMLSNKKNAVIYTGVTSNLVRRIYEHKREMHKGFSKKYQCKLLVYFEIHKTVPLAIEREKQIKAGNRDKKIKLIEEDNPKWSDLYSQIL